MQLFSNFFKKVVSPPSALDIARAMIQVNQEQRDANLAALAEKVAEDSKPPEKHIPTEAGWEIKRVNGDLVVHILDNNIRKFICVDTNSSFLNYSHVSQPEDDITTRKLRTKQSVYKLVDIMEDMDELDMGEEDDFIMSPLLKSTFDSFVTACKEADAKDIAESKEAFAIGRINYDQLTRVLEEMSNNELIGFGEGNNTQAYSVYGVKRCTSMFSGPYLELNVFMSVSRKGRVAQRADETIIRNFEGVKSLKELGLVNLQDPQNDSLKAQLIARGKRHLEITAKPTYLNYEGNMHTPGMFSAIQTRANGRIMVDLKALVTFNPNYNQVVGGSKEHSESESYDCNSSLITETMLMTLPPVVYGFSLLTKMWGEFDMENISPIQFKEQAFSMLQLPVQTKKLLSAMVENVSQGSAEHADIISGKGGGAIILLAGLPGLGKTLSAEVVAENLKRPLYMVNVGELGVTAGEMEKALQRILNTAAAWNAILLIDEADIFLEARTEADVARNAMVAVFLRLLEYYTGILFLTTNRANNIDPAFYSRIHLALYYDELPEADREIIWNNLMGMRSITGIDSSKLAKTPLNGRQIKNILSNAVALAKFEKVNLTIEHFNTAIGCIEKFEKTVAKTTFDTHGNMVAT